MSIEIETPFLFTYSLINIYNSSMVEYAHWILKATSVARAYIIINQT